MRQYSRRKFLNYMAASLATPYMLTACRSEDGSGKKGEFFDTRQFSHPFKSDSGRVFSLSVASGDPTTTGVVLWTRIDPDAYRPQETLYFQVAGDKSFRAESLIAQGQIAAAEISRLNDYTVHIDLDGLLAPDRRYFYRFIYTDTVSHVGRCKTVPADDVMLAKLKLAVLNCQDYTNGYYAALSRLAGDESIDFVVHLGDYIYETVGDPRFQDLPFEDRRITLPSAGIFALGLDDYRHLYQRVRSDPFMQQAMENHTWIITTDDHETADDCYWDYERDTLGAPGHPFTLDAEYGNAPSNLTRLKLDAQQAWAEYIPARVHFDHAASHPHHALSIYRKIKFGALADLFMTDTRTYRTAHPCGEEEQFQRYLAHCDLQQSQQSLYGEKQRDWVFNGVTDSRAQWKVLGNQTFMGRLGVYLNEKKKLIFTADAWDGYESERVAFMEQLAVGKVENLVVLTGDLHSAIASHLRPKYNNHDLFNGDDVLGVEFMSPAISSANMANMVLKENSSERAEAIFQALSNGFIRANNPHIEYFSSMFHGYATIEFTPDYCDWRAYSMDKNINREDVDVIQQAGFRKYADQKTLVKL